MSVSWAISTAVATISGFIAARVLILAELRHRHDREQRKIEDLGG